jgi:hypothetical protein
MGLSEVPGDIYHAEYDMKIARCRLGAARF